ncbi:MAG: phosphotransferase [Myxococcota bacterium]
MLAPLTQDQIESILSLYRLDPSTAWASQLPGGHGLHYDVQVPGGHYVLRLLQQRSVDELVFEKDLLLHLTRRGFSVPRLLQNMAKGSFTPWTRRGRYVSVFRYPKGRVLGRFEIRPRHLRRIGAWLARFHGATSSFAHGPQRRSHPSLEALLDRASRALERRRLARRCEPLVMELRESWARLPPLPSLPSGLLHGNLGLESVRFAHQGRVGGVSDFESANGGPWVRDLARVVVEWCWCPEPRSEEGPAGSFRVDRLQAFLRSYAETRPLAREEWGALESEVRRVCLREAAERLLAQDRRSRGPVYRDPRHYAARLRAPLDGLSPSSSCERTSSGLASKHR